MAISASEARKNLFGLIQQVNDDVQEIEIVSKNGSAVLVSAAEWRSIQETAHLLRSPANARRLLDSIAQAEAGNVIAVEIDEDGESYRPATPTPKKRASRAAARPKTSGRGR